MSLVVGCTLAKVTLFVRVRDDVANGHDPFVFAQAIVSGNAVRADWHGRILICRPIRRQVSPNLTPPQFAGHAVPRNKGVRILPSGASDGSLYGIRISKFQAKCSGPASQRMAARRRILTNSPDGLLQTDLEGLRIITAPDVLRSSRTRCGRLPEPAPPLRAALLCPPLHGAEPKPTKLHPCAAGSSSYRFNSPSSVLGRRLPMT